MQAGDYQDSGGNILSPEAKEFIPRQPSGRDSNGPGQDGTLYGMYDGLQYPGDDSKMTGQQPVGNLPGYMTTCYPFVPSGETSYTGARTRGRGKYNNNNNPQMFIPTPFSPTQTGLSRSRFPNPGKGHMQSWNRPSITDIYQPFSNVPNGMPFDGGTYQNGFVRPNLQHVPPANDNKPTGSPGQSYQRAYTTNAGDAATLVNGYESTNVWNVSEEESVAANGNRKGQNQVEGKAVKMRTNVKTQTDFPESLANATLEDIPNSLFLKPRKFSSAKARHKAHRKERPLQSVTLSDSDQEDNRHISISHGKNQVSNGTNPATIGVAVGNTVVTKVANSNQHMLSYKDIVTGNHSSNKDISVPYSSSPSNSVISTYATVAQGLSSHKNKPGPVSMGTKSDKETCDSSGKGVKGNIQSGLSNVNVAQIMEDLEKAGSLQDSKCENGALSTATTSSLQSVNPALETNTVGNESVPGPVYTWGQRTAGSQGSGEPVTHNNKMQVLSYSQKVKQQTVSSDLQSGVSRSGVPAGGRGSSVGCNPQGSVPSIQEDSNSVHAMSRSNKGQVQTESCVGGTRTSTMTEDRIPDDEAAHASDNQEENSGVKKKRRRRRRRKKKSGEAGAVSDDANSGANDEVMLHFEDEEEFPDLGGNAGSDNKDSSPQGVAFSYSDILKTTVSSPRPMHSLIQEGDTIDPGSDTLGASPKESRSSRKRRKRREVANKAADAEMAEINLEQHMLELKMKQKHPVSAKKSVSPARKSVSPVRTSPVPVPSIWKHPPSASPSQPPSSGKKVSLLLPGTVAPDNLSASRQPNPSAKQYSGILKTTQSAPTQSTSIGGGSGGGTKKSKQPITYDLGALIDALEEKKNQPPPSKKEVRPVLKKKDEVRSGNMLDSSAPVRRGKERETPKIKKPSPLKKVILKEREEKKRLRLLDDDDTTSGTDITHAPITTFPNSPISAPVGIGVVSGESDLSQDASSSKGSMEVGLGTPASAELSPISQPSPSCISPMSPGASPISSGVNSPMTGSTQQIVKLKIHSRRFREYCNQVLDKEIDNCVVSLLADLVRFQDKQYHKDPIKAKAKRRFVLGLREVTKHLKLRKIKCVIISPNLEKIQSKGGLDDALNNIIELCNEQGVPFVFALGRRALGRACAKLVPVSVVGIFNYEGSEENFKSLVSLTEKARDSYKEMINQIEKEIAEQPPRAHVPGVPHIFAHMGHSRTPSGCSVISFTSSILSEPISENYPYSEPETDNRGYEIEKGASAGDGNTNPVDGRVSRNAQDNKNKGTFEKDPYEADDESGRVAKPVRFSDKTVDSADQHIISGSGVNIKTEGDSDSDIKPGNSIHGAKIQDEDDDESDEEDLDDLDRMSDLEHVSDLDEEEEEDEDFDTGGVVMETTKEGGGDSTEEDASDDNEQSHEDCDTIRELPYIDSVHHFDLHEILSTHSSKTLENGEDVLSTHSSKTTHSSRTPAEGTAIAGDKGCKIKIDIKHGETTSTLSLKGKNCLDKENRTLSWVKEAQTLHFNEQIECNSDADESSIDVKNVGRECLDVVA